MKSSKLTEPKQPKRFEIWLVSLDPTVGREIKKTRPCLVISPDEMSSLATTIVAPLTSKGFPMPVRVKCKFKGKEGLVLLDHMRSVDKRRLIKYLGKVDIRIARKLANILVEMFEY